MKTITIAYDVIGIFCAGIVFGALGFQLIYFIEKRLYLKLEMDAKKSDLLLGEALIKMKENLDNRK